MITTLYMWAVQSFLPSTLYSTIEQLYNFRFFTIPQKLQKREWAKSDMSKELLGIKRGKLSKTYKKNEFFERIACFFSRDSLESWANNSHRSLLKERLEQFALHCSSLSLPKEQWWEQFALVDFTKRGKKDYSLFEKEWERHSLFFVKKSDLHEKPKSEFPTLATMLSRMEKRATVQWLGEEC